MASEPASPCRVLVVDDSRDTADTLRVLLRLHGYAHVCVAYSSEDALRSLADFQPHVALIDLGMPVMSGIELAAEVRRRLPRCRLVAVTGHARDEDRQETAKNGFSYHLVKPVNLEALMMIVSSEYNRYENG